jgi:diadenosine tetraphosphatase ApaH/serine/threonine PP2A family protein phosphatase
MRAERFVFLGDYVGYGADPVWVTETVMALVEGGAVALKGNHDAAVDGSDADMNALARAAIAWTREQLEPRHRAFLESLPLTRQEGGTLYVHANAHAPASWDYILGPFEAGRSLSRTTCRLVVCGHVHMPALYALAESGHVSAFRPSAGAGIPLLASRRWLAVVGAVGQPRDGIPAAAYALLDQDRGTLTYWRVPYDYEAAAQKIRRAGLPEKLAMRLELGR